MLTQSDLRLAKVTGVTLGVVMRHGKTSFDAAREAISKGKATPEQQLMMSDMLESIFGVLRGE